MEIAILVYDHMSALDVIGPYEVLKLIPNAEVRFTGKRKGKHKTDFGSLLLIADYQLADVTFPDALVVPGGRGAAEAMRDSEILDWIRNVHSTAKWVTSVCTGSLILAAAGILRNLQATSHWLALDLLRQFNVEPIHRRVVRDGKIITSAGVSAGIDMALTLVGLECGDQVAQAIQLGIEYDPQPPYDAGSPEKAPSLIVDLVRGRTQTRYM